MKTRYLLVVSLFALSLPMCRDEEPAIKAEPSGAALAGAAGGAGQAGGSSAAGRAGGGLDAAGNGAAGEAGNAGRAGNAGHAGSAGRAPFAACPPDLPGPVMVQVPVPGGQTDYCIDTTEVTQAQYAAFLVAKGDDVSGQREECAWNMAYKPHVVGPEEEPHNDCELPSAFDPTKRGNYPMACVDFCDAVAYCEWAGKRLCGRIGGGMLLESEEFDAKKSQWFNACSSGGQHRLPYGDSPEKNACNVKSDNPAMGRALELLRPVDVESRCVGKSPPFDAIRDLVGNLPEWEDGCFRIDANPYLSCPVRGSGATSAVGDERETCRDFGNTSIGAIAAIGFRCCLD